MWHAFVNAVFNKPMFNKYCRLRQLVRDRSGASALEMALVLPVFLTMMIGVLEIGRYIFTMEALRSITAEAARLSMIDPTKKSTGVVLSGGTISSCTVSSTLKVAAATKTPFIDTSSLTLCISNIVVDSKVTIIVSTQYPFTTLLPILSVMNTTLTDNTTLVYRNN